jgi:hypothetical protein
MARKKRLKPTREEKMLGEEQGFLDEPSEHTQTTEEFIASMAIGEKDTDVYSEEGVEEELDNDELAPWEAGFMHGEQHPEKYEEIEEES